LRPAAQHTHTHAHTRTHAHTHIPSRPPPAPNTPPPPPHPTPQLAVGYTLDQIPNDITRKTPASFEPSIDYIVTKIPKFNFEKFPGSKAELTTQARGPVVS
jgi:hypothetical protein